MKESTSMRSLTEPDKKRALEICTNFVSCVGALHFEIRRLRIGDGFKRDQANVGAKLSLRAVEEVIAPAMDRLRQAQQVGPESLTIEHFDELDRATKNLADFVKELRKIGGPVAQEAT